MSNFPQIRTIDDIRPFVKDKKEISFIKGPEDSTIVCYQFQDSNTFDSPQAAECRGIVFDRNGNVAARPLHKFFNLGEKGETVDSLDWSRVTRVMDKADGSMINTVWLDGKLWLKSKKSFNNKQVEMAWEWLRRPENRDLLANCNTLAFYGWTVIFELVSPSNRIVVAYPETQMYLLHVRSNYTGEYLSRYFLGELLHGTCRHVGHLPTDEARWAVEQSAPELTNAEGYVLQFDDGNMVKVKSPWYLQLHRTVSFTRERDIAEAAVEERLDDIKAALSSMGVNLASVEAIEADVMHRLLMAAATADSAVTIAQAAELGRKDFALRYKDHPMFGLLMAKYLGKEPDYKDWFKKHVLKQTYSLDPVKGMPLSVDD